ncbi:hypothetical protein F5B17DRAFT_140575 [Nemania serpens]|nr:hypothetical protein F5B17DRAFT_140575 [Nemania serpens]
MRYYLLGMEYLKKYKLVVLMWALLGVTLGLYTSRPETSTPQPGGSVIRSFVIGGVIHSSPLGRFRFPLRHSYDNSIQSDKPTSLTLELIPTYFRLNNLYSSSNIVHLSHQTVPPRWYSLPFSDHHPAIRIRSSATSNNASANSPVAELRSTTVYLLAGDQGPSAQVQANHLPRHRSAGCYLYVRLRTWHANFAVARAHPSTCDMAMTSDAKLTYHRARQIDLIDKKTHEIRQDDEKVVYKSLQEIADDLPDNSPRYILLSYPLTLVRISLFLVLLLWHEVGVMYNTVS